MCVRAVAVGIALGEWAQAAACRACALVGRTPTAVSDASAARAGGGKMHPHHLSPEALMELRSAFNTYDTDGNGTIEPAELRALFASLGASQADADKAFAAADILCNGVITFDEFCASVGPLYEHSEAALKKVMATAAQQQAKAVADARAAFEQELLASP